jgi:uncharacterized protein YjbI with pentapeptide repeats
MQKLKEVGMLKLIGWLLWDFTGLRFIFRKLLPQKYSDTEGRPPSTIVLWLIGLYLLAYAGAYQRYANRVDIIETRANAIFEQISSPDMRIYAINRISAVQNMPCPNRPIIWEPLSIFRSFYLEQTYSEIAELLKATVENLKADLASVNLSYAYLVAADLSGANLKNSQLTGANLQKAQLSGANLWESTLVAAILNEATLVRVLARRANLLKTKLQKANLRSIRLQEANLTDADLHKADLSGSFLNEAILVRANLRETNLMDAYFQEADLTGTDFRNAVFTRASLKKANLTEANLKNTIDLTVDLLCETKSLFRAKLDPELEKQVKEQCPQLLKKP